MTGNEILARSLAESLPICDEDDESDVISLCDLVVTGFETGLVNWRTRKYSPDSDGTLLHPWAIVAPLPSGLREGQKSAPVSINAHSIRDAVALYAVTALNRGTPLEEVQKLLDGSYTDAEIADAIIQTAIYGEVVFG